MHICDFLKKNTKNLSKNDISDYKMEKYENFTKFIEYHYNLEYMKKNNYIKYVKVIRQKIVLLETYNYDNLINKINKIFIIMNNYGLFFKLNFRKYLFNIKKIYNLLKKKKISIQGEILKFKLLFEKLKNEKVKMQILKTINSCNRKYILFIKYQRELLYYIDSFNKIEESFGIEQELIDIVNSERRLLGKKSEYNVNKIIKEFIIKNNDEGEIKYHYLINVDIFKLFNIKVYSNLCKGEIDGIIVSENNNEFTIEYIIEIKSSIKATFEDIHKIMGLKKLFLDYSLDYDKYIDNVKLNNNSFNKLINNPINDWLIYICTDKKNRIDKSNLYFCYVLKIVDYDFIKDYYVNNKDNIIKKKYNLILDSEDYINNLFLLWSKYINLTEKGSCIFIL